MRIAIQILPHFAVTDRILPPINYFALSLSEAKLYSHDLQSNLKEKTNEIVSSKQTIEVAKTETDAKLCRQKLEAAKEVSWLETEVDKLKILLRGTR